MPPPLLSGVGEGVSFAPGFWLSLFGSVGVSDGAEEGVFVFLFFFLWYPKPRKDFSHVA